MKLKRYIKLWHLRSEDTNRKGKGVTEKEKKRERASGDLLTP
jgi:hypothetical protein